MNTISGYLIFLAGSQALLTAAVLAFKKNDLMMKKTRVTIYFVLSLLFLEFWLTHSQGFTADMTAYPFRTLPLLCIRLTKYSIGPLLFFFFAGLTDYRKKSAGRILIHFIPQVLVWITALLYFASSLLQWQSIELIKSAVWIMTNAGFIHIILYLLSSFLSFYKLEKPANSRNALALLIAVSFILVMIISFLGLYFVIHNSLMETAAPLTGSAAFIAWYFVTRIDPDLVSRLGKRARTKSYQKAILGQADAEILKARLAELMEIDRIYCDEDLSLARLSSLMGITRHRLSELLNSSIGTGFTDFVNSCRISEAKRLLLEEPERSILSIAYASGFNSKSVFYAVFRAKEKISPMQFREQSRQHQ